MTRSGRTGEAFPRRADRARWLEELYQRYHRPELRGLDPIDALAGYPDLADREIVGLIAALLAYGNVRSILRGIAGALDHLSGAGAVPRPIAQALRERSPDALRDGFRAFRYRVTSGEELGGLLIGVRHVVRAYGSLNACFVAGLDEGDDNILPAVGTFVEELTGAAGRPLHHLLPHPARGSACKRLMLYLRWMVRRDAIDPGGWSGVRPDQLVIPLDTHLFRMARGLGFTRRRQPNLRTAVEITEAFRRFAPDDPLRYDFALTRPGILGLRHTPSGIAPPARPSGSCSSR